MRTLTVEKAAELVTFLDEDMSAAVLYELAQEPYDPDVQMKNFRKTLRYGGLAADIMNNALACTILARFPDKGWAGAVLREMVIYRQTVSGQPALNLR